MYPPRLMQDCELEEIRYQDGRAEPYEELGYMELIGRYAGLAGRKKELGVQRIVLREMPSMAEARAALLGCRLSGVPVYVTMAVENARGGLREEQEALAALLCLQALGVDGFGLDFPAVTAEVVSLYAAIAPYSMTPLLARPRSFVDAAGLGRLLQAGVDVLCAGEDEQIQAANKALEGAGARPRPPRLEDAPLLLCDETGVYYLEEDFTISEPIDCSLDMSEEILAMEEQAVDALCFRLETAEDAMNFGRNAHMCRCAVSLQAASTDVLELALTLYPGRALVDSRCDLEESRLLALAKVYGAIVR